MGPTPNAPTMLPDSSCSHEEPLPGNYISLKVSQKSASGWTASSCSQGTHLEKEMKGGPFHLYTTVFGGSLIL
jgi:hypothetical protein